MGHVAPRAAIDALKAESLHLYRQGQEIGQIDHRGLLKLGTNVSRREDGQWEIEEKFVGDMIPADLFGGTRPLIGRSRSPRWDGVATEANRNNPYRRNLRRH